MRKYLAAAGILTAAALSIPSSHRIADAAQGCPSTIPGPGYVSGQFVQCAVLTAADLNHFSTDMLGAIQLVQAQIPTNGATSANQTNGSQKTQIVDGSGTSLGTNTNPVQITGPVSIAANQTVSVAQKALVPQALSTATITTAGVSYVALTGGQHANGGWIRNCNAAGTMYVNDQTTATQSETGNNAALFPGSGGTGALFSVPPGTTTIYVTGSANGMAVCGEGFN